MYKKMTRFARRVLGEGVPSVVNTKMLDPTVTDSLTDGVTPITSSGMLV